MSRAHRSLIAARNALGEQAKEHPHGWGIGWYAAGEAYVIKSERPAHECESFRRAADQLASNALVAHVRRATVGSVTPFNVHPFRNGRWLFAHNGTIFGFDRMRDALVAEVPADLRPRILGSTDTEVLFFFLLGKLVGAGHDGEGHTSPPAADLARVLRGAVQEVCDLAAAGGHEPPVLNFLLTNGAVFAAHRMGRELYYSTQKIHCRDALTCAEPEKPCLLRERPHDRVNHLLVASERIGDEDTWEEVPEGAIVTLGEDFRLGVA